MSCLTPERLKVERHGAIRLGKPDELAMVARLFAQMGMEPVGYYDLAPSGVPVHSTAFRPTKASSLAYNPFRVFTSLLLPELLPEDLRAEVTQVLAKRDIFHPRVRELVEQSETQGGLSETDADELVTKSLETFKWHDTALVPRATYERMHAAHPLVADIAAFRGPHINHLTPRALDIDAAQAGMSARHITPKQIIEGPPKRACEILLRQTSFQALTEPIRFPDSSESGAHRARFGEIEQRGCALTRKGHDLYLALLATVPLSTNNTEHQAHLEHAFKSFPDTYPEMHAQELGYFEYQLLRKPGGRKSLPQLITDGDVVLHPVTYEDFLPASAAGIFQSNLDETGRERSASPAAGATRDQFAALLPMPLRDSFALHAEVSRRSFAALETELGYAVV